MKFFRVIYDFFREIRDYQIRNTVFLLITLCLSLFLALGSNVRQKQVIDDLEYRLLDQQNEINQRLTEYQSITEASFPELKDTFNEAFAALENRLESSQITFSKNLIDASLFLQSCSSQFSSKNLNLYVYKFYLGDSFIGDIIPMNRESFDVDDEIRKCAFKGYATLFYNEETLLLSNRCLSFSNNDLEVCEDFQDLIYIPKF